MVRNLYQYIPATTEFTVNLLQLISHVQLHWTHTKEVEIASLAKNNTKGFTVLNQLYLTRNFLFI